MPEKDFYKLYKKYKRKYKQKTKQNNQTLLADYQKGGASKSHSSRAKKLYDNFIKSPGGLKLKAILPDCLPKICPGCENSLWVGFTGEGVNRKRDNEYGVGTIRNKLILLSEGFKEGERVSPWSIWQDSDYDKLEKGFRDLEQDYKPAVPDEYYKFINHLTTIVAHPPPRNLYRH